MAEDVTLKAGSSDAVAAGRSTPHIVAVSDASDRVVTPSAKPAEPTAKDEKKKVVDIVQRLQEEVSQSHTLKKRRWLLISIFACIALPTIVASVYYFAIAADRYVAEARFAIRNSDQRSIDALGMITGLSSSPVISDSYIVADYIGSLDMVKALEQRLPLTLMYRDNSADFLSRLGSHVSQEDIVDYWNSHIDIYFDSTKQTISVAVQAFKPEDAQRIASEIVDLVHDLVNELSAQARRDAVKFAASELARTELRLRAAREAVLNFRLSNNELDPSLTVESTQEIITELEGQRSQFASQLASVSGYLSESAPSVRILKSRIAALADEIDRIRRQISEPAAAGSGSARMRSEPLANTVGKYQQLLLDQEFAEKAHTAAQVGLDQARAEAAATQIYLAVYAKPMEAEDAIYPRRWINVFVVLVVSSVLWAVGALGFLTVREHAG